MLKYVPQTPDPFQNDISCKYNGRMAYHRTIIMVLKFSA